jgi:hypothetical protein
MPKITPVIELSRDDVTMIRRSNNAAAKRVRMLVVLSVAMRIPRDRELSTRASACTLGGSVISKDFPLSLAGSKESWRSSVSGSLALSVSRIEISFSSSLHVLRCRRMSGK